MDISKPIPEYIEKDFELEKYIALIIKKIVILSIEPFCYIEERSAEIIKNMNYDNEQSINKMAVAIIDLQTSDMENKIKMLQKKLDDDINRRGKKHHLSKGEKKKIIRMINKLKHNLKKSLEKRGLFFTVILKCFDV